MLPAHTCDAGVKLLGMLFWMISTFRLEGGVLRLFPIKRGTPAVKHPAMEK